MKSFTYITKLWTALCFGFLCFSLATPLGFAQTPTLPEDSVQIATSVSSFVQGAPALADEMNNNFEILRQKYNDLSEKFNQLIDYVDHIDDGNITTTTTTTMFVTTTTLPPTNTLPDLVAHQKFENSLTDSITGNTAIAKSSAFDVATQIDYSAGKSGQALELRNVFLEMPSADPWDLNFPNYSISFWVKAINNGGPSYILKLNAVTGNFELVTDDNSKIAWKVQTTTNGVSSDMEVPQSLNNEQWHHVVLVQDGGSRKLYFDSILQHTDNILTPQIANAINRVGGVNQPSFHDYFLDEMRLYDGALTQAQINDLFNNP